MSYIPSALSRRRFVEHLFRSPLVLAGTIAAQSPTSPPIESSGDALDVFDFAPSAQGKMSPAHWAYLMTGVDDNLTRDLNHDAFQLLQIRPRRFVDVEKIDTSIQILGQRHPSPIVIDPVGSQRAFHSDGELATARAAHALGNQMILSTVTTTPLRDVAREYQRPLWYQLYASNDWGITKGLIQKAEEAGCPVLMVTVDTLCGGNRETVARAGRRGSEMQNVP